MRGALYACSNSTLSTVSFSFTNGSILNSTFVVVMVCWAAWAASPGASSARSSCSCSTIQITNGAWVSALPGFIQSIFAYPMLVYAVVLVIIIMFRPKGIFGTYEFSLLRTPGELVRWIKGRGSKKKAGPQRKGGGGTMSEVKRSDTPVLETRGLGISFGGLKAVQDFNIKLYPGELAGLIGPNGAGKTTVFNLLTGVYVPTEGSVILDGEVLNGRKTHQFVEAGIARTFQNIRLFRQMSVIDNVKAAFSKDIKYRMGAGALPHPRVLEGGGGHGTEGPGPA